MSGITTKNCALSDFFVIVENVKESDIYLSQISTLS